MNPSPFAALAAAPCPPVDACLIGVAEEFRTVDAGFVEDALDDRARSLFGIARAPARERAAQIVAALADIDCAVGPESLFVDRALAAGRAAPVLLCAIAHEVARRAGCSLALGTVGGTWVVTDAGDEPLTLAPVGRGALAPCRAPTDQVTVRCGHALAFELLNELTWQFEVAGCARASLHASELRLALPLAPELRAHVLEHHARLRRRLPCP